MEIILYENISEYNKLSKTLLNETLIRGNMVNETTITNPTIIIEASTLANYNYLYIPELRRYYFINEITNIRTNLWRVNCSVDVLMSFKNEILNLNVIIDKQATQGNANYYFDDGSYVTETRTFIETIEFERGFNTNPEYILITAGGGKQTDE